MRFFPLIAVAWLLSSLLPTSAHAQEVYCKPCWHNFGQVQVGDSSDYSIQLWNTGKSPLKINTKSEQGAGFSFGKFVLPVTLQPGASIEVPVVFTPTAKGYISAVLTLNSNAQNSPLSLHVHGNGFEPSATELEVTPATLSFGKVNVGSSATLQATLSAANGAVTISSDQSTSSEFAIIGLNLPVTVAAGQSIPVTIQFTPNASGTATGKAGFISNATDSPTIEQLTGNGVAQGSHSVSLTWQPGDDTAVGYNVFRGIAQGGPYTQINTALDASTNYTDNTVGSGDTYYYVATEVNAEGQESAYSNVAQAVIPNP